ncbi:MAG: polysaccharide deacetylase [Lachnospiraceae bacterium]|nr:polysaccharide deacetylase [Lachnospiraceae bacterium]
MEQEQYQEFRRKRVARIKKILIILLIVSLTVPNILCIILFIRMNALEEELERISERLEESIEYSHYASMENAIVISPALDDDTESSDEILSDSETYPGKKLVYLTFDDGPSKNTDAILDLLSQYNVKATFFVLAKENLDDKYRRIIEEGHTLAIHSYTHKYDEIYASKDSFRQDIDLMKEFLENNFGYHTFLYRFPGGSSNQVSKVEKDALFQVLKEEELDYVDWNVTSQDASVVPLSADKIANNVYEGIEKNQSNIVLLHDAANKSTTVEALSMILDTLSKRNDVVILPIAKGTDLVQHVRPSE